MIFYEFDNVFFNPVRAKVNKYESLDHLLKSLNYFATERLCFQIYEESYEKKQKDKQLIVFVCKKLVYFIPNDL